MTALSQSQVAKLDQLLQWLQTVQTSPKNTVEGPRFLTDVDLLETLAAIFTDLAATEGVRNLCKLFYESYISGDKNVQLLVTLLLPSMLRSYLIGAHQGLSQEKRTSPAHSPPSFTLGADTAALTGFDALSFLLIDLCSLAPNCLRAPDIICVDQLPLPDPQVSSVFHDAPETVSTPNGSAGGGGGGVNSNSNPNPPAVFLTSQKITFGSKTPVASIATSENVSQQSLHIAACLLQVCTDTLIQQKLMPPPRHGSRGHAGDRHSAAVFFSARSFCSLVQRVTSLTERPRIRCTPSFLITLLNCIDSFLFLLNFERDFKFSGGSGDSSADGGQLLASTQLRSTLFKLLGSIDRFANYHCFSSVLLLCSAVRHAWLTRYRQMPVHLTATERRDPCFKPMSSIELAEGASDLFLPPESAESAQPLDADVLTDLPVIGESPVAPHAASKVSRKTSAITNASFKPESVPEDIPITKNGDDEDSKHHHRRLQPRQVEGLMFNEQLTRSTENVSSLGGGGEGEHESKNVRRTPIAAKLLHLNI